MVRVGLRTFRIRFGAPLPKRVRAAHPGVKGREVFEAEDKMGGTAE